MSPVTSLSSLLPLLLLVGLCSAGRFPVGPIDTLVVFGDSISDKVDGAIASLDGEEVDSELWAQGMHVEAGAINWVAKVAKDAKLDLLDYAVGGSTMCGGFEGASGVTLNVMQQVDQFLAAQKAAPLKGKAAAVIMLGTNDWMFFFQMAMGGGVLGDVMSDPQGTEANKIVQNISACAKAAIMKLQSVPALKKGIIYVATLEAIEHIPFLADMLPEEAIPWVIDVVDRTNTGLRDTVRSLNKNIHVKTAEETVAFRQAFTKPPAPLVNVSSYCLAKKDAAGKPVMCKDVQKFAFFDEVHYTATWHAKVIAPIFMKLMKQGKLIK